MVTVVLGNFKLSFTATDCISQFLQRTESTLAGQHLLQSVKWLMEFVGRWRNKLQVELLGVTCRASLPQSLPEYLPFVQSWNYPPSGRFRTMLLLTWREGKPGHFHVHLRKISQFKMLAGRNNKGMAPTFKSSLTKTLPPTLLSFVWLTAPRHSIAARDSWEM